MMLPITPSGPVRRRGKLTKPKRRGSHRVRLSQYGELRERADHVAQLNDTPVIVSIRSEALVSLVVGHSLEYGSQTLLAREKWLRIVFRGTVRASP